MNRVVVEITAGTYAGRKILLRSGACLRFGRTERADYVIPHDSQLSSLHFQVACQSDEVTVEDLGSTNGTFVNGERIQQHVLSDGDVIAAGETTFCVSIEQTAEEAESICAVDRSSLSTEDPISPSDAATVPPAASHDVVTRELPESRAEEVTATQAATEVRLGQAILAVQNGASAGRKIWLRREQSLTIGNSSLANVSFPDDAGIAASHCKLTLRDEGLRVRDLVSTGGTFLNEVRVAEAELAPGDELRLGNTRIIVTDVGGTKLSTPDVIAATAGTPELSGSVANPASWVMAIPAGGKRPYKMALQDEDPLVRQEALLAAAWTRQPWLLEYLRRVARQPAPEADKVLHVYAILAPASDVQLILRIGNDASLGPRRMKILGAFGHPGVIDTLLAAMHSDDKATVYAAGQAYAKITGADIESEERVTLPPADGSEPDEFEAEFLEEVKLPNPQLALRHWADVQEAFSQGTRWCRGHNLSPAASLEIPASLDLESRWETCLRARYEGRWQGSLVELVRLTGVRHPGGAAGG